MAPYILDIVATGHSSFFVCLVVWFCLFVCLFVWFVWFGLVWFGLFCFVLFCLFVCCLLFVVCCLLFVVCCLLLLSLSLSLLLHLHKECKELFGHQRIMDAALRDVAGALQIGRPHLGILAAEKGLIAGGEGILVGFLEGILAGS